MVEAEAKWVRDSRGFLRNPEAALALAACHHHRSSLSVIMAGAALLCMTACSTVETRRADPATLETSTTRSLTEVQTCLSDGFDRMHLLPTYRPTAGGGTYTLSGQGYVQWVIDIYDADNRRQIMVHAVTSIWGKDKKLITMVQGCAG